MERGLGSLCNPILPKPSKFITLSETISLLRWTVCLTFYSEPLALLSVGTLLSSVTHGVLGQKLQIHYLSVLPDT